MVFIIGIAGPSSSGKSTICTELQKHLPNSSIIHTDDYWCNPENFPKEKGVKNWELPECLDFDRLYTNLLELGRCFCNSVQIVDLPEELGPAMPMIKTMSYMGITSLIILLFFW